MNKKQGILAVLVMVIGLLFISCSDAMMASANLSTDADNFKIYRRVVFYNGITNDYILSVEGYSSITVDTTSNQLELTVKTDNGTYLKHFLGLSDNTTYFVEQLDPAMVSDKHYKVIFKPSVIVPIVELR